MLMALLLASPAVAQDARGALLIDRNRADRVLPAAPPVRPRAPVRPSSTVAAAAAAARPITGIRFVGAQAPAKVAAAARSFLGQQASKEVLTRLAAALSAAYEGGDVALYTVAIPEQDFTDGVVTASLTEGRITTVQLKGARPGSHPLLRRRLARMTVERPLRRATFERQMALIGAIPGLTVTTEFADPAADGALVLTATPKQRRTKISAGFSSRGVALLGDGQLDARGEFYGAAVDGDQLSVSGSAAGDLRRYRYGSLAYSAPIGARGLIAAAGVSYLETRPKGYPLVGRARQVSLSLAYPLVRRTRQSIDVSLGVDALNSDNAAFGNLIASERTRAVRLATGLVDAREKRSVSASASLSRGIGGAGARIGTPFASATFLKFSASGAVDQAIGKRVIARVRGAGQHTPDVLPAAERLAVGGEAIGRAFDTGLFTGDSGGGGSAELAWRPLKSDVVATSEVYAFGDYGAVRVHARPGLPAKRYSLASAGAGVRARYREKAELGLEAARALHQSPSTNASDWRISIAWRVSS